MGLILIGGGARSGKSRFALELAGARFERPAFIATAEAHDEEMEERIRSHQAERGPGWTTVEEPLDLPDALETAAQKCDGCVVDCLTLWLSNVLLSPGHDEEDEIKRLLSQLESWTGPPVILVTNEVGCGIVPENVLARRYRDLAGNLNQQAAALADEAYWMAFGLPIDLKKRADRAG